MDFNEFQTIDDLNAKRRALAEDLRFVDSVITAYSQSVITAYSQRLETSENHPAASLERVASQTSGERAGATESRGKTQPQLRRETAAIGHGREFKNLDLGSRQPAATSRPPTESSRPPSPCSRRWRTSPSG